MNQIINNTNLRDPNIDLVSVLLGVMADTGEDSVTTHDNILFAREGSKLRVEGPDCDMDYELILAIDQVKQNILQKF